MKLLPYTQSCFVCGAQNPHGLKLRFWLQGDCVQTTFIPREEWVGFQGMIHGGILAAILDEVMVWAASVSKKRFHFCVELNIRYSKPVKIGTSLTLTGRVSRDRDRVVETTGELRDEKGRIYTKATAKYMPVPDHEEKILYRDIIDDPQTIPLKEILT